MATEWQKVDEGIRVRNHPTRKNGVKPDQYFVLRFSADGQRKQEALGWASEGWTLAKARAELARLKEAARTGVGEVTLEEKRAKAAAARKAESEKPTIARLWMLFQASAPNSPGMKTNAYNFKHLAPMHHSTPDTISTAEVKALGNALFKAGKAAQTVKHVIGLLRRLIRFGVAQNLCDMPPRLVFEMPEIDNAKTECLTPQQAKALLLALDEEPDQNLASLMRLALATGMRKGALLALQWQDIDFRRGFITLQGKTAKSRKTSEIPLSNAARGILESITRHSTSPYVFCNQDGTQRKDIRSLYNRVREKAALPDDFRPLHGLRHTFASWLASSGQVGMYDLQKLLTHSDPKMTQRYSHLSDEAMKRAAAVSDTLYDLAANAEPAKPAGARVLPFPGKKKK